MSRVGEIESAEAFFDWVARIATAGRGFDARYTLAGERDGSGWPHRQHDGWGLWLWGMREHSARHGRPHVWSEAAAATAAHLEAVRTEPCIDWWEERKGIHAATLACIAAGLEDELDLDGAEDRLDASLLVLPFLGFDAVYRRLGARRPRRRRPPAPRGHLLRRRGWLLLTALLGLAEPARARDCLDWIVAHERAEGLPEQRKITCFTRRATSAGSRSGGRRPRRSSGRTRCS